MNLQGNKRTGNYGTSANSSSHAKSSWRLKEVTEGLVTVEVGSLFQYFTTSVEKDDFLRRRRLWPCRTLKGWPPKPGRTRGIKKRLVSRSNPPENIFLRLWGFHGDDVCVRIADSVDVFVPHMAVGGNTLRASSPTTGVAPNNRHRHHGSASMPA